MTDPQQGESSNSLAFDIGGTKIAASVVSPEGNCLGVLKTVPTPALLGPEILLGALVDLGRAVLVDHQDAVSAIGIGSAGTFDKEGTVLSSTRLIRGWAGFPLGARVAAAFELPTIVINDVHATTLGEVRVGAGAGVDRVLLVAVGTGIGGGFSVAGQISAGASGTATAIGHVEVAGRSQRMCSCGRENHLEAYSSGPSLEAIYAEASGHRHGLRQIADLAKHGDALALAVIRVGAETLGRGLGSVANVLDPDLIVLSGGVAELGELLMKPLTASYRASALPGPSVVPVVHGALGGRAPLIGAGASAIGMSALSANAG